MPLVFRRLLCLLALGLSLSQTAPWQSQSPSSVPNSHQDQEEAALRAVVDKYFFAYGKKDLAGVMALWSEKSLDLATHRQNLQQQFTNEDLSFGSPAISRVKLESEKASLRVTIVLTSVDLKSRQKSEQQMVSNLELVKEDVEWKVWRYAPAAEDLAAALVKADTEAEREELLAEEKESVTVELEQALLTQGQKLIRQGNYRRAMDIYRLALKIAGQSGDKGATTDALRGIGDVHRSRDNYTEALEQYRKSLQICEEIGDKTGIARSLNSIGIVHASQGNYPEALDYFRKSLRN
jgi:tetratricopeptide (TPR) repeat protein